MPDDKTYKTVDKFDRVLGSLEGRRDTTRNEVPTMTTRGQRARQLKSDGSRAGKLFPVAAEDQRRVRPGSRAKATGERRPVKPGEWFLSGAVVEAYYNPRATIAEALIAVIVPPAKSIQIGSVIIYPNGGKPYDTSDMDPERRLRHLWHLHDWAEPPAGWLAWWDGPHGGEPLPHPSCVDFTPLTEGAYEYAREVSRG